MLYLAALALLGFACMAFRWSVMICVAGLVFLGCAVVLLAQGAGGWTAVFTATISLIVVQVSYVVGGALLSLRLRRVEAKKNIKA